MSKLFGILLLIGRIYIICKITFLLFMTQLNPMEYPMEKLTWWIYFLVFDKSPFHSIRYYYGAPPKS